MNRYCLCIVLRVVIGLLIPLLLLLLLPCATNELFVALLGSCAWRRCFHSAESFTTVTNNPIRIVLLGDSLVNRSFREHNLGGKLQSELSGGALDVINCGYSAVKVAWLLSNAIDECVLLAKPDAVFLLMDTDVSDVNEEVFSREEVELLRTNYHSNLTRLVQSLQQPSLGISFIALCSPGVLGETSYAWFQPLQPRFHHKADMLQAYTEQNRAIAANTGIAYIDVQRAFHAVIPRYQLSYAWCCTKDGEHLNERGTQIVATLMAQSLKTWLVDQR